MDICSAIVDGIPPTPGAPVLFRRFFANAEFELTGFLTVKFWSGSTRISLRARDISCWTSGHWSVSSFKTCEVSKGVWGTVVYCCKAKKRKGYLCNSKIIILLGFQPQTRVKEVDIDWSKKKPGQGKKLTTNNKSTIFELL